MSEQANLDHAGPDQVNPKPRFQRTRRIIGAFGLLYITICIGCSMLQEKLIFPGAATQGMRDAVVSESATTKLVHLKLADGTAIVARFDLAHGVDSTHAPTVLLFYGNGQCAQTTGGVIDIFQQIGCNVLTPDYPGYGMSGGKPSEKALFESANVCWEYLQSQNEIDHAQLHIVGWSLGTGVAIDLASRVTPKSLTTISAYTSITDMGKKKFPFLPIGWINRHPFRSIDKIDKVKCPILMIHGAQDPMIPPAMTRTLSTGATSPVKLVFLPNAGHNDIFDVDQDVLVASLQAHLK